MEGCGSQGVVECIDRTGIFRGGGIVCRGIGIADVWSASVIVEGSAEKAWLTGTERKTSGINAKIRGIVLRGVKGGGGWGRRRVVEMI